MCACVNGFVKYDVYINRIQIKDNALCMLLVEEDVIILSITTGSTRRMLHVHVAVAYVCACMRVCVCVCMCVCVCVYAGV